MSHVEFAEVVKQEERNENTNENFKSESSELDDEEDNYRYVVGLVTKINGLAHFGHFQAQEAELRAENAISLAERSINEALSVRELSEHLTRTARDVTELVKDFLSRTKLSVELPGLKHDIQNIYEQEVGEKLEDKLRRLHYNGSDFDNVQNIRFPFEEDSTHSSTSDEESSNGSEANSSDGPESESDGNHTDLQQPEEAECGAGDRGSPVGQCVPTDKVISNKDVIGDEIGISGLKGPADKKEDALACGHAYL